MVIFINVICTTFPCVGFVGLKREIVHFPYQLPTWVFAKFPYDSRSRT